MRILHVTQRYLPALGGSEALVAGLATRLVQRGHSVTIATTDALDFALFWEPQARRISLHQETIDDVRVLRFPVRHLPLSRYAYPGLRRLLWLLTRNNWVPTAWLHRISKFTPYVPDLFRWLATTDEEFDVVVGTTIVFESLVQAARLYARRKQRPFVVFPLTHLGAGPAPGADPVSAFYTMRHQVDLVRSATFVVGMTPTEATFYTRRGVPGDAVAVAGPGITPDELLGGNPDRLRERLQIREPLVGVLSSLSVDKGSIHLLEAVRRLRKQGEDIQLVMGGAITPAFQRYWDRLSTEERRGIHLLGAVDEQTKRDFLAAIDVFAMPSRTDSFGIVYLEAWLYGKPVIGAQAWGMADMIRHGEDGFLVPFGDVAALAQAIHTLLRDPALAARLGAQGRRKTLAQHTWDDKVERIEQIYTRLAGV